MFKGRGFFGGGVDSWAVQCCNDNVKLWQVVTALEVSTSLWCEDAGLVSRNGGKQTLGLRYCFV